MVAAPLESVAPTRPTGFLWLAGGSRSGALLGCEGLGRCAGVEFHGNGLFRAPHQFVERSSEPGPGSRNFRGSISTGADHGSCSQFPRLPGLPRDRQRLLARGSAKGRATMNPWFASILLLALAVTGVKAQPRSERSSRADIVAVGKDVVLKEDEVA